MDLPNDYHGTNYTQTERNLMTSAVSSFTLAPFFFKKKKGNNIKFWRYLIGEYFVLGVDLDRYDADNPSKYLRGSLKDDLDQKAIKAFENYVGVVGSPSGADFDNFTQMVNDYLERPPFNFFNPLTSYGVGKRVQ